MKLNILSATTASVLILLLSAAPSHAFCGVVQETAHAKNVDLARSKAQGQANQELVKLRRQYGKKFKNDRKQVACLGGGVAIDASGKKIKGRPSCTVSFGFCVNP